MSEDPALPSLTVGTAGHIDHGKTALVRALTGKDTDRLEEERRRGMSIELGYAELDLGDRRLSLVDVPGHERFVRTMIAGASGIDLFLLVVAVDDGVMPQTREHARVLRALGVVDGVVALTKVDLVERERIAIVAAEVEELLPGTEIVRVSSHSGEGIKALRISLAEVAERLDSRRVASSVDSRRGTERTDPRREDARSDLREGEGDGEGAADEPILHVDRAFTVAGHGTVVTGTLWSGTVRRGDRVVLLPGGKEARVRSIESHDHSHELVGPRRRVALNLAGLGRDEVERGDVVTRPGSDLQPTYRLDVALTNEAASGLGVGAGMREIIGERRVQVHHGTRESPARVVDLGDGVVQLRLEQPLLARHGDHVVVRRIAPPDTLGGAVVIDAAPPRRSVRSEISVSISRHTAAESRQASGPAQRRSGSSNISEEDFGSLATKNRFAPEPASRPAGAMGPSELARRVLSELDRDGDRPRTPAKLAEEMELERREVERAIGELVEAGEAVRFKADVVYPTAMAARLAEDATALAVATGSTSIAEVRDALGLSRKYAQALLEHLDGERVLRRDGDRHVPRGLAK